MTFISVEAVDTIVIGRHHVQISWTPSAAATRDALADQVMRIVREKDACQPNGLTPEQVRMKLAVDVLLGLNAGGDAFAASRVAVVDPTSAVLRAGVASYR